MNLIKHLEVTEDLILKVKKYKMAELIVEEFDVCHKFVGYMSYLLPLNQRDHVSVQHVVGARSFTFFFPLISLNITI